MEKEFITYEQALALKKLGFDEPCFGFYFENHKDEIELVKIMQVGYDSLSNEKTTCTTPLIQQAFRFFREKYGLYYYIILDEDNEFYFTIYENGSEVIADYRFFTYQEAEQACLNKLIQIAKESKQ